MHLPSTAMHIFGLACLPPHVKQQCCRCRCVVLSGLCSSNPGEEVCVTYSNTLVRINTLDLRSQVRQMPCGCLHCCCCYGSWAATAVSASVASN
jgi:hypothetical protein